jgi:hypothetical protein
MERNVSACSVSSICIYLDIETVYSIVTLPVSFHTSNPHLKSKFHSNQHKTSGEKMGHWFVVLSPIGMRYYFYFMDDRKLAATSVNTVPNEMLAVESPKNKPAAFYVLNASEFYRGRSASFLLRKLCKWKINPQVAELLQFD